MEEMKNYRDELVAKILENTESLTQDSAYSLVSAMSVAEVFEMLDAEPDQMLIAQEAETKQAEHKVTEEQKSLNTVYEKLKGTNGRSRIETILNLKDEGIGSIIPDSLENRLADGQLTGANRLSAIFEMQNHHHA